MDNFDTSGGYRKEDDFEDTDLKQKDTNYLEFDKNVDKYDNPLLKTDVHILTEDMSEPDISYWCSGNPEATQLLKKCINLMKEKNYKIMKTYLENLVDSDDFIPQYNNNEVSKIDIISFVKYFYLGVANFKLGEYDEALSKFYKSNELYQYYQLHYNIALCCIKKNMLEEAVLYLDGVITKKPDFYFAYYNLIRIYLAKRNPSQAYVNYRRLSDLIKKQKDKEKVSAQIESNANNRLSVTSFNVLKLFYKLGAECSFHLEYHQECVHTILEALKFNPEDPELWCLYGKVFILKKAFDYAKPLIERAIELDPDYDEAKNLLNIINNA